jgi:hypothetical protein
MQQNIYELPVSGDIARSSSSGWLALGLISLVFAGVYSVLLVLARTPVVQSLIPFIDFFQVSLVVHVTLSVLVWLLSISAAMWSLSTGTDSKSWDRASIIIVSPFIGAGRPQMSNYVPVLDDSLFFSGLCLFTAGIASHATRALFTYRRIGTELTGTAALQAGITISAAVTVAAIV